MHHSKHFTLDEARQLLSEIKPLVERMVDLKKILSRKRYDIYKHQYFGGTGPNGTGELPPEMDLLVDTIKKISYRGVLIKSIDDGLIDFPSFTKNSEEIYLCWMYGEDEIGFWHRIETGFQGRRSINEL